MRILVAEDSPANLFLIQGYLKGPSFELDVAENGARAVEKFQSDEYSVVLMDLQMPIMDGYTATQKIREWEKEHQKPATPILALTAHALQEEQQRSLAAGCTAHLTKPIRKATLLEAIQKYTGAAGNVAAPAIPADGERIRVEAPDGIEEAVPLFLDLTRHDLLKMRSALQHEDYPKLRFIGHDLKGAGSGYGFDGISAIGKAIEDAARQSNAAELERQIGALADYLERVEVVYR